MATTQSSVDPKIVSEVAKQEGGTTAGSNSAQLQSQMTKERNAQQLEDRVKAKMDQGIAPTHEEANTLESREHRAKGYRPESGTLASQAQSAAEKHANGGPIGGASATPQSQSAADKQANAHQIDEQVQAKIDAGITPSVQEAKLAEPREHRAKGYRPEPVSIASKAQSAVDKETNFAATAGQVEAKLHADPKQVTEEDANALHRADRRAHGTVEKGGLTSQAQHQAAENKGVTGS